MISVLTAKYCFYLIYFKVFFYNSIFKFFQIPNMYMKLSNSCIFLHSEMNKEIDFEEFCNWLETFLGSLRRIHVKRLFATHNYCYSQDYRPWYRGKDDNPRYKPIPKLWQKFWEKNDDWSLISHIWQSFSSKYKRPCTLHNKMVF